MSFVAELKRRKVFQVAAVYLVVAWLIMQVVDMVNEPLRLPEWFATVAILLVAIGFPIALILSWAFDVTPEGATHVENLNRFNTWNDPILDQPEFVEVRSRLGFSE